MNMAVEHAKESLSKWPRIREKDFRRRLLDRMVDENTPPETTPRQIADELIKEYAATDRARALRPKVPKTVFAYIRYGGGVNIASILAAGHTAEDFRENGAGSLLRR